MQLLRSSAKMASMLWVKVDGSKRPVKVVLNDLPGTDVDALLKKVKETS